MSENFPAFSQDVFVGIVKNALHLSKGTFWGQKFRRKNQDFPFFPGQWAEKKAAFR